MHITSHVLVGAVTALNQPLVKEALKNSIGFVTLTFGVMEIYDEVSACYSCIKGRIKHTGNSIEPWWRTALRVVVVITNISLILSAISSRPGLSMSGWVAKRILTPEQLVRFFGPNYNFATTPFHPRHITTLISFAMSIPATMKTCVEGCMWLKYRLINKNLPITVVEKSNRLFSQQLKQWMATWNCLTSRPALHLANNTIKSVIYRCL